MRGMWLQAQRKSRDEEGSSLGETARHKSRLHTFKETADDKKINKNGVLEVSVLAEDGADTLQQGGPVGLMREQGQKIRPVGWTSSRLEQGGEHPAASLTPRKHQGQSDRRKRAGSHLGEGKQQLLLKVWTHRGDFRVQVLEPVNQ